MKEPGKWEIDCARHLRRLMEGINGALQEFQSARPFGKIVFDTNVTGARENTIADMQLHCGLSGLTTLGNPVFLRARIVHQQFLPAVEVSSSEFPEPKYFVVGSTPEDWLVPIKEVMQQAMDV
jgi:hypothetical protein